MVKNINKPIEGKNTLSIILFFILLILVINNIRSLINYRNGLNRLTVAQLELEKLETQNIELFSKIEEVQTSEFVEKTALERLNLTKEPQTILIMESLQTSQTEEIETAEISGNIQTPDTTLNSNISLWIKALKLD